MTPAETASLISAIAGSIGALGTWFAAVAALRTTRIAKETTERAAKALARTSRPQVNANLWVPAGSEPPETKGESTAFTFYVRVINRDKRFAATNIEVELRPVDGRPAAVLSNAVRVNYLEPEGVRDVVKATITDPLTGKAGEQVNEPIAHLIVRFQDENLLMTWEKYCGSCVFTRLGDLPVSGQFVSERHEPFEVTGGRPIPLETLMGRDRPPFQRRRG